MYKISNMTQQETKQFIFQLTTTLVQKQCYIKGYGNQMRICDHLHNPIMNISKSNFNVLMINKIIRRDGLMYVLNISVSPFKQWIDVKLPLKFMN